MQASKARQGEGRHGDLQVARMTVIFDTRTSFCFIVGPSVPVAPDSSIACGWICTDLPLGLAPLAILPVFAAEAMFATTQ